MKQEKTELKQLKSSAVKKILRIVVSVWNMNVKCSCFILYAVCFLLNTSTTAEGLLRGE